MSASAQQPPIPPPTFEKFERFSGLVTSVDPANVPAGHASDSLNARTETGAVKSRPGWRNLGPAVGTFTDSYGFDYCQGYTGAGNFVEAYLAIQKAGGVVKAYEINPSTGARTEVKDDGGAALALAGTDWQAVTLNGTSYAFSTGAAAYRHEIGTVDSWAAVDAARPGDPTVAPSVSFAVTEDISTSTAGGPFTWAGAVAGTVVELNGAGVVPDTYFDSVAGGDLIVRFAGDDAHTLPPTAAGVQYFRLDLSTITAGVQDLSADNEIGFNIDVVAETGGKYAYLITSLSLVLQNNSGTRVTMDVSFTASAVYSGSPYADYYRHVVKARFPAGYTASDWATTKLLEFQIGHEAGYVGPTKVRFSQVTPATDGTSAPSTPGTVHKVRFATAYYDSRRDVESENVMPGSWYEIEAPQRWWDDPAANFLGNLPTVTATASGESQVDQVAFYVQFASDNVWRYVGVAENSSPSLAVDLTYAALLALTERQDKPANPVGSPVCACAFGGFVAWGYAKGEANIRMSGFGNAVRLYRAATDTSSDPYRGYDYTLADNLGDSPKWMGRAADTLVILGEQGAYTMNGNHSYAMTFPARVAGTIGVLGRAAAVFKSDRGLPAVAWVGKDQEIYAVELDAYGGATQYLVLEMSRDIRGLVRSYLTQTDNPDTSLLWLQWDERTSSLRAFYGTRCLALRRQNLLDNQRPWEKHTYNVSGWGRVVACARWGIRAVRTTGETDEVERNSAANFAEILGANRDGGAAMPDGYWTSGVRRDLRRAWQAVTVFRSDESAAVTVTVISDRASHDYTVAAKAVRGKNALDQQGHDFQVKVKVTETSPDVQAVWGEVKPSSTRPIA